MMVLSLLVYAMVMKYSIVIPIYNEEESIKEMYRRVKRVMDTIAPDDFEIVFVNDGSTDKTKERMLELMKADGNVKGISFRKNMGKAAALSIGFEKSRGDYVITMDGDLQDEPKEIPKLIEKMNEGYDMVSGWKENRQDGIDKTLPSKVFNYLVSQMSGVHFHDFNCGFKLYKRQVVKELDIYGQLYRFIPVLVDERGFKIAEVHVKHNKRKYGKSKYNWTRFFAGVMDLITVMFLVKYARRPLHVFGLIGSISLLIGFGLMVYLLIDKLSGHNIINRPWLILGSVLIISGLEMVFTGLLAEMITKMSHSYNQFPIVTEEE